MNNITPSDQQNDAIKEIVDWYASDQTEFYLAGYAGVGKTTIVQFAIEELKNKYSISKIRNAAYTGKAASVLRKKGISDAQTIHSLIYIPKEDKETGETRFILSPASPAEDADLIILDECSMVDKQMAADLRSFDKKILVMGDPGQLPPVNGEGEFTNREPDVFLSEIHRQAAESPIIELATLARQGKEIPRGYKRGDVAADIITRENQALLYREDTQPICGLNRVRHVYNKRIRERRGFSGNIPQKGERLICCRNNSDLGIYNGGMGTLEKISQKKVLGGSRAIYEVVADMEDVGVVGKLEKMKVDPHHFNAHFGHSEKILMPRGMPKLNEFDFGYAITCHKAQGSSWDDVTVIDDSHVFKENRNKWLYTAITRAENKLTLLLRD